MRILLDRTIDRRAAQVLQHLGHEITHARDLGDASVSIIEQARDYEVLITLDLFRQRNEWFAIHREMFERTITVVQIRPPKHFTNPLLETLRALLYDMEDWLGCVDEGCALIIIREKGRVIEAKTRHEIGEMLQQRISEETQS